MTAGLAAAQVLPALAGGIIGVPAGIALFSALNPSRTTLSPQLWMLAVALGAPMITAILTALPARIGANRPVAAILQCELAIAHSAPDSGDSGPHGEDAPSGPS